MNTHQILNPGGVLSVEQLIFGLKNLETLYVLGRVSSQEVGEAKVEMVKVQEVEYSNGTVVGDGVLPEPPSWINRINSIEKNATRMLWQLGKNRERGVVGRKPPSLEVREVRVVKEW
jgi:hypothetical protein